MSGSHDSASPFRYHLDELKRRGLTLFALFIFFCGVGYFLHEHIFTLLVRPLGQKLIYTSPTGGLEFVLNISLWFGVALTFPFVVYHAIQFVRPAIAGNTVVKTTRVIAWSYLLLLTGMTLAYYFSLPFALRFLSGFSGSNIEPLITVNSYLSFVTFYLFGFGAIFLLPVVLLSINSFYRLETKQLARHRGLVLLISFVIAAILTPTPDPINQTIMAAPMVVLYEVSMVLIWWRNRRQQRLEKLQNLRLEADQAFSAHNWPAAQAAYSKLIAQDSSQAKPYGRLGWIYLESNNLTQAEQMFRLAADRAPAVPSHQANLAITLFKSGKVRPALRAIERAIRLDPDNQKYLGILKYLQSYRSKR